MKKLLIAMALMVSACGTDYEPHFAVWEGVVNPTTGTMGVLLHNRSVEGDGHLILHQQLLCDGEVGRYWNLEKVLDVHVPLGDSWVEYELPILHQRLDGPCQWGVSVGQSGAPIVKMGWEE